MRTGASIAALWNDLFYAGRLRVQADRLGRALPSWKMIETSTLPCVELGVAGGQHRGGHTATTAYLSGRSTSGRVVFGPPQS